jgi:caffeoyl-CoA O-methyltransferase
MIQDYADALTPLESPRVRELIAATTASVRHDDLLAGRVTTGLLRVLVRLTQARRVLEIGMFTGVSALSMAELLPDHGEVVALETNTKYAGVGVPILQSDTHGRKVRVVMGPALESIKALSGNFDLVFLDADKDRYPEYLERVKPRLRVGGVIVLDNAYWKGEVEAATTRKGASVHRANIMLLEDPDFENVFLPFRDGLHVAVKVNG